MKPEITTKHKCLSCNREFGTVVEVLLPTKRNDMLQSLRDYCDELVCFHCDANTLTHYIHIPAKTRVMLPYDETHK